MLKIFFKYHFLMIQHKLIDKTVNRKYQDRTLSPDGREMHFVYYGWRCMFNHYIPAQRFQAIARNYTRNKKFLTTKN